MEVVPDHKMDDIEALCWEKAVTIQFCERELTSDKAKKHWLRDAKEKHTFNGINELLVLNQRLIKTSLTKRKPLLIKLGHALITVHEYAPNFDVMLQQAPGIASLTWGSVRFIIQAIARGIQAGPDIAHGLQQIIFALGRLQTQLRIFSDFTTIVDAIGLVLGYILYYLISVQSFINKPAWRRPLNAAFITSKKLLEIQHCLEEQEKVLQREVDNTVNGVIMQSSPGDQKWISASDGCNNMRLPIDPCYKWLRDGIGISYDHSTRAQDTCLWIQDHPTYRKWIKSGYISPLWVVGKPGCGKSVLASYITATASTPIVLSYRFRASRDGKMQVAAKFAATCLANLIKDSSLEHSPQLPTILRQISKLKRTYSKGSDTPATILLALLKETLHLFPEFTLVIDSLDECADQLTSNLDEAGSLLESFDKLGSYEDGFSRRLILLSRPSILVHTLGIHRHVIFMTEDIVSKDVTIYAKQEIERRKHSNPHLLSFAPTIISKIRESSQGMFLWATFVLESVKTAPTVYEMEQRLTEFPTALNGYFERQLKDARSQMHERDIKIQYELMLALIGIHDVPSAQILSEILAIDIENDTYDSSKCLNNPAVDIVRLCSPLVTVYEDQVEFIHCTAREYLLSTEMSQQASDELLLRKSLTKLNQEEYRSWTYPARIMRENLLPGGAVDCVMNQNLKESVSYTYACLHWQDHLFALPRLSVDLLDKLGLFLKGNQFVTWAEVLFQLRPKLGIGAHVQIKGDLSKWSERLTPEERATLGVEDFLVFPYEAIRVVFQQQGQDALLPYLPFVRLGMYFNVGGKTSSDHDRAYAYKQTVARGYEAILGARNPLTLRAKTQVLKEYFFQKQFDKAEQGLKEILEILFDVFGDKISDYVATLQLLAAAQYSLTDFQAAIVTFTKAVNGFTRLNGSDDITTLTTRMAIGQSLERVSKFDEAYETYLNVLDIWLPIGRDKHPFSLMLKTSLGSVCRKLGKFGEGEQVLLEALTIREQIYTVNSVYTVDTAIQVTALYYAQERYVDALEYLNLIANSESFQDEFERKCQEVHMRALIDFAEQSYEKPKLALQRLLNDTDRSQTNRELLWIRITLADALRSRDENGEALMVFSDLVCSRNTTPLSATSLESRKLSHNFPSELTDEPEPPFQLKLAEKALRLVQHARVDEANALLCSHDLKWRCSKDFWVMQGGPITDTALIAGARLLDFEIVEANEL